jgi:hypothetical protein
MVVCFAIVFVVAGLWIVVAVGVRRIRGDEINFESPHGPVPRISQSTELRAPDGRAVMLSESGAPSIY